MTKRAFYTLFTLGWLGAMPLWAQQVPELVSEQGYADLVLINGKIVSMDDRSTRPDTPGQNYQSMATKGKRIMALGSNQEMRTLAGPATRILDRDFFTIPVAEIPEIEVVLTGLGGQIIYDQIN